MALAISCSTGGATGPGVTATSSAPAAGSSSAAPSARASAPNTVSAAPDKARALLAAARKLEKEEKWREATAILVQARDASPDDVVVLSELGWAALRADDLETSTKASERALEIAKEPRQRASVLYNLGRVLEAKGDKDGALGRYKESLALRPSKTIEERIAALGGKAPDPPKAEPLPCQKTFANTADLCTCLLPSPAPAGATCGADASAPKLESGDLEVVRTSTATEGETAVFVVANVGGGITPVADIGRDYHPDAFGIDSSLKILGFDEQKLGERRIAVLRAEQTDTSTNAGGADVATLRVLRSTVCVLREGSKPTKCPLVVPLETDDRRVFRTEGPLTPEQQTYVDAHKGEARDVAVRLTLKLSAKGYADVGFGKGDKSAVPQGILGRHELF